MLPAAKLLFSRCEAAEVLELSVSTIQELIHRGLLPELRIGRKSRIHRREIERALSEGLPKAWEAKRDGKTVRARRAPEPEKTLWPSERRKTA